MKQIRSNVALLLLLGMVTIFSCNKNKPYEVKIPESQVNFVGPSVQTYEIGSNPAEPYTVTIGSTDVINEDRTIGFSISSPTGAAEGTQYTVSATSVTIPAGQATATFEIVGDYAQYSAGRKDTLVLTLSSSGKANVGTLKPEIRIFMRGPCFDGDVTDINIMGGNYTNTFENGSYGPYITSISGINVSGTTASATINNLYDYFGPLTINLDWTDPTYTSAEIPFQQTDKNYQNDPTQPFYVRTHPGSVNKFSVCNQTFSFELDVIVEIGGTLYYYDQQVVYTMAR